MAKRRVIVIEDDAAIRRGLLDALRFGGFDPAEASDGASGLRLAVSADADLVLLDVIMPKMDGFTVLEELRRSRPSLPVILLTARGAEEDRVRGLRTGADDYVVKPFSAKELLARVDAVLRRSPARPRDVQCLEIRGRTIDFDRREVRFSDGSRSDLSEKEVAILHLLAANPGRAVSRSEILERAWGLDPRGVLTRTIDMHVARLRERLRDNPESPEVVLTVRGIGYSIAVNGAAP